MITDYPRIARLIYQTPWLVLPATHETIRKQFENHLQNPSAFQMPMDDEDEEEEFSVLATSNTAVLAVDGIIGKHLSMLETMCGGVDVDMISEQLDAAMEDESIENIVMYFNTPGGTVVGVPEIAEKIAECGRKKKTIAYADVLCASAGYYMASQCDAIYCAPSATLGSVGVYSIYLDESRALENMGVKVNAISAGSMKLAGAPFKPMTDEERAMFQAETDRIYNDFKAAVTAKRNITDSDLQGQVFSGPDVIDKGFADGFINSLGELLRALDNPN
jgi:protease-4